MFRCIAAAAAILAASCSLAYGQTGTTKVPSVLNAEVNSLFPDQNAGQITPFNARQTLLDLVASSANLATTGSQTFSGGIVSGTNGGTGGSLTLNGATSGAVTQVPQAVAGTPTVAWGTSSGTPAVTASGPLAITAATGNATCATCATTTNGGALSATAPIAISAGGVISITSPLPVANGGTGDTGTAWTAFTASPVCGTATFTTNAARSKTLGKTTWITVDIAFTALGTCTTGKNGATTFSFSLPNTSSNNTVLTGQEFTNSSGMVACVLTPGSAATFQCVKQAAALVNWTATDRFFLSGVYENQ
jgi:hypothetical protein